MCRVCWRYLLLHARIVMHMNFKLLFLFTLFSISNQLAAQVIYKCTENGIDVITDKPCANAVKIGSYNLTSNTADYPPSSSYGDAFSKYLDLIYANMQKIEIGMSKDNFLALFPIPKDPLLKGLRPANSEIKYSVYFLKVNRTKTASGVREQWVFDGGSTRKYYYFDDGFLTAIQD